MSNTVTEWVSAPTEMKSTPVSATSRARSRVSPPDASSEARPAVIRTASAMVALSMLSSRIRSQPASSSSRSWSRSVTSTSTGQTRVGRADRLERRHHAAGGDHVVVLDHRHVGQAEPVVDPAAAPDGVLLQGAVAGQRLAGVEHPGAGAGQRVDPARGRRRDAGQVAGEVEGGALGGQQAAGRAADPHDDVAAVDAACRPAPGRPRARSRPSRRGTPARRCRARRRRPARAPRSRRTSVAVAGMVATLVTSSPPSGRSSSSAPHDVGVDGDRVEPRVGELREQGRRQLGVRRHEGAPSVGGGGQEGQGGRRPP